MLDRFDSQRRMDRGARVSGNWTYGSGSSFARWVLVTSMSKDADGRNVYRAYLVPKEDVELTDGTWDSLGLRATASVDYAIRDKFVPTHRTYHFFRRGWRLRDPYRRWKACG